MTGRRVVQYLIDSFLVGIIPALVSIPFDRSNSTVIHVIGGIVSFAVFVLIGLLYWVIFTHMQNGQTLGMKLLRLRVISKGGGPANMAQLTIRWICLIFDAIPYTWPFTGLLGFIVILCSRDRQRIGDHLARTLVIATDRTGVSPQSMGAETRYAGTGPSQPPIEPHQQGMGAHSRPRNRANLACSRVSQVRGLARSNIWRLSPPPRTNPDCPRQPRNASCAAKPGAEPPVSRVAGSLCLDCPESTG